MNHNKLQNKNGGFTLIEIIVSLALFTTVAVIAVGALLRIMDANKKSISIKTVTNNVNFALESMTREMRVGTKYFIDSNINSSINRNYTPTESNLPPNNNVTISSGPWVIAFNSSKVSNVNGPCNLIYAYRYNGTRLQKAQQSNDCNSPIVNADFQDIVSTDIIFTKANVRVDARFKPRIEFLFSGYHGVKTKEQVTFNIQTKVSQRIQ